MINLYQTLNGFPPFSKKLNCKGLLFTQYDCPQLESREQLFVECSYIAYVLSGRRVFHKNSNAWELKEGACAFVKKGTHVTEKPEGESWCVMVFFMPDNFLKQLIQENRNSLPLNNLQGAGNDYIMTLDVNELARSFFFSMLPYFTQTPPPPENLLELKFKELILSLLANKKNEQFLSYLRNLDEDLYPTLEEVMQDNYMFNLTLEEYAKLACKSVPTFKREFKRIFNESPARWVVKKRVDLASELLENSTMSVAAISYDCGFESQSHFSRVFKEKTGLSPLQFRTKLKAGSSLIGK